MTPQIGKEYKVFLYCERGDRGQLVPVKRWGKCVFIHPKRRFCCLDMGGYRECFTYDNLLKER